jgi:octaprenyl-diphosphate synthase
VVDGAVLRRGSASANSVWGNEASVLVGDYLFAQSFSILVQLGNRKIMDILSRATVVMAEGEVLQLANVRSPVADLDLYLDIVRSKTAALISAACQCGGVLGDVTPEQELALKNFGLDLGMAFQFTDDVLDYVGEVDEFGKTRGNDFAEGKLTLPLIYALSRAPDAERNAIDELFFRDTVQEADFSATVSFVENGKGFEFARREAEKMAASAKKNLDLFPDCEEKQALLELADHVISRRR